MADLVLQRERDVFADRDIEILCRENDGLAIGDAVLDTYTLRQFSRRLDEHAVDLPSPSYRVRRLGSDCVVEIAQKID